MKKLPHGALTYRGGTCPSPPLPPWAARGGRTGPPAVRRGARDGGPWLGVERGALGAVGNAGAALGQGTVVGGVHGARSVGPGLAPGCAPGAGQ